MPSLNGPTPIDPFPIRGLVMFFVGFFIFASGLILGAELRSYGIKTSCLVYRTDLAALSNERLDSRIQTLQDALEYTITVRMTRSMDERDRLEAERTGLEMQLDPVEHAPIP